MKRVILTGPSADRARGILKGAKGAMKSTGTKRVGITTWLSTTVRDNVPFSAPRVGMERGHTKHTAKKALTLGRKTHRMVETFVTTGKVPPLNEKSVANKWARNIIRVLAEVGNLILRNLAVGTRDPHPSCFLSTALDSFPPSPLTYYNKVFRQRLSVFVPKWVPVSETFEPRSTWLAFERGLAARLKCVPSSSRRPVTPTRVTRHRTTWLVGGYPT